MELQNTFTEVLYLIQKIIIGIFIIWPLVLIDALVGILCQSNKQKYMSKINVENKK